MRPWEIGITLDTEQKAMVETAAKFAAEVMRPAPRRSCALPV